jgi:hypothetical protein
MKTAAKQPNKLYNSDSQCSAQRRTVGTVQGKPEDLGHFAKSSAEEGYFLAALDRLREGAGIRNEDLSDRIVCQAGAAILGHWQPKDKSTGEKIATAPNALAEMQPTNAMELMLAAKMLAVNDAVFLFMSQATLVDTSSEKRDFYTEKASSLMSLYVHNLIACCA